jgi:hypothetical protein
MSCLTSTDLFIWSMPWFFVKLDGAVTVSGVTDASCEAIVFQSWRRYVVQRHATPFRMV